MGGTCVNLGCVPKKLFAYASTILPSFETLKTTGGRLGTPVQGTGGKKNKEIERLNGIYNESSSTLASKSSSDMVKSSALTPCKWTVKVIPPTKFLSPQVPVLGSHKYPASSTPLHLTSSFTYLICLSELQSLEAATSESSSHPFSGDWA